MELVYITADPWFSASPELAFSYIQPAWRFSGQYRDGTPFEALVQALQPQYLR